MNFKINKNILDIVPLFNITCYHIKFKDNYDALEKSNKVDNLLLDLMKECQNKYNYDDITKINKLKETRDGYKAFGKDPSHTRPAAEALLRRMVKGNMLYRLGDVIDLGNILSIKTLRSVCVVDYNKLVGNIEIRLGTKDDSYQGIGRDIINVENIPVYFDEVGPFGSPTSDTRRTIVDSSTKEILIMIINFSYNDIEEDEKILLELYQNYTAYIEIEKISKEEERNDER